MRHLVPLLLLVSCASVAPDEYHVWYAHSEADAHGSLDRLGLDASARGDSVGVGITWYGGRREELDQLRIIAARLEPPAPEVVPVRVVELPPEFEDVALEPPSEDPLIALLGSAGAIVAGVVTWFLREKIPGVRRFTAAGRAEQASNE